MTDVASVFFDRPDDTATILRHGFVHAHYRAWQLPVANDPYGMATAVILQFDTSENAAAVLAYFHQNSQADGRQQFAVPAQLVEGYGDQVTLPDGFISQGVSWRVGSFVVCVGIGAYAQIDADQTIAWAVSQSDILSASL